MSSCNVCSSLAGGVSNLTLTGFLVQKGDPHHDGYYQYAPHLEVREGAPHLPTYRPIRCHPQVRVAASRSRPLHLQRADSRLERMHPEP